MKVVIVLLFALELYSQDTYWIKLEKFPGCWNIRDITFDIKGYGYFSCDGGIFKTYDDGNLWESLGLENKDIDQIIIDGKGYIYIDNNGRLLRSKNEGVEWEDITKNLGWSVNGDFFITKRGYVLIGQFRTTDNGDSFTFVTSGIGGYFSYAMNSEGHIFRGGFGSNETICRSTDDGDTWEVVYEDPKEWPNGAVCETVHNMIFSKIDPVGYACWYKTINNGRTWYIVDDADLEPSGHTLTLDSIGNIYSFRSAQSLPVYYKYLFKRIKDSTWVPMDTSGLNGVDEFNTMATSPNGYIYLAAHNGGLYRSRDRYVSIPEAQEPPCSRDGLSASPNPFSDESCITFSLDVAGEVTISLYDLLGRQVAGIFNGWQDAGRHSVQLLITNYELPINPGMYFLWLETQKEVLVSKILILR